MLLSISFTINDTLHWWKPSVLQTEQKQSLSSRLVKINTDSKLKTHQKRKVITLQVMSSQCLMIYPKFTAICFAETNKGQRSCMLRGSFLQCSSDSSANTDVMNQNKALYIAPPRS